MPGGLHRLRIDRSSLSERTTRRVGHCGITLVHARHSSGVSNPDQFGSAMPPEETQMVTSIILINAERNKINEVAEQLQALDGISEVYSVSGAFDLIAIVRVKTNDDLAALVTRKMLALDGIAKTETMLAFKAYSKHDLEAMFAVGM